MTRATVVIVNWNGAKLLPPCLDAVRKQDMTDFETWVVDNGSTDGSTLLIRERYPWVKLVRTNANLGFAGGNNAALKSVTTPYAVLLNNDAIPEPDWLSTTLASFDDDGIGAVTPKILFLPRFVAIGLETAAFEPGPPDPRVLGVRVYEVEVGGEPAKPLWEKLSYGQEHGFCWTRPSGELLLPVPPDANDPVPVRIRWAAERSKDVTLSWGGETVTLPVTDAPAWVELEIGPDAPRLDVVNNAGGIVFSDGYGADRGFQEVDAGQFDAAEEVFTACGNGVAFRREVLEQVGLFDDDFFLYYEDTDLSWRLRAAGWRIKYEPRAVLRHHHSASSGEWSPVFRFHTDRNRLLMLTKNARWRLALPQVLRYPLTMLSILLRAIRQGHRPPVRDTLLRVRVVFSYLRLLPTMLARRRGIRRRATVSRRELERWLTPR